MGNIGKKFENAIKRSAPDYMLLYRLPDAAQSFGGGNKLRFSWKNPFDFLLWDSQRHMLFALELKTVAGKSISFERTAEDVGDIHLHQVEGLLGWSQYDGITAGFIIEFRAIETTVFIPISGYMALINAISKKSFSRKDLDDYKVPYVQIPQKKLRTQYRYDIESMVNQIENDKENEL